jgi:hypothetical protein
MRKILAILPVLFAGAAMAACASASAKTPAERPALNVPLPPARVIESVVEIEPEPVGDLPAPPNSSPPARPNRPAKDTSRSSEAPKTEPKTEPVKPVETAPPEPPPAAAAPPAQLKTPQTADSSGAAKTVQATIDRARATLNTVSFQPLSAERKKAYNDVKNFIQQAEDAVRQSNFVFAQAVANKAETLARDLAGK